MEWHKRLVNPQSKANAKKDCKYKSCKECPKGTIWVNPSKRKDGTLVCGYCRKASTTKKKSTSSSNNNKATEKKKAPKTTPKKKN